MSSFGDEEDAKSEDEPATTEKAFSAADYCANCCFRQDPPLPPGRKICDDCERQIREEPWREANRKITRSIIESAGTPKIAIQSLLDHYVRLGWLSHKSSEADIRRLVDIFWKELEASDKQLIRQMLLEKASPEPDTFLMLVQWSRARLKLKHQRIFPERWRGPRE